MTYCVLRWEQNSHSCKHARRLLGIPVGHKVIPSLVQKQLVELRLDSDLSRHSQLKCNLVCELTDVVLPSCITPHRYHLISNCTQLVLTVGCILVLAYQSLA